MLNRKGKKRCWHLFVSGQNISVSLKGWRRFILTAHWPCTGKLLLVLFVFGVQMFSCFSWQIIDCLCLSECRCGTLSEKSWTGVTLKQSKSTDNIQKQLKYLIIFIKTFVLFFFSLSALKAISDRCMGLCSHIKHLQQVSSLSLCSSLKCFVCLKFYGMSYIRQFVLLGYCNHL